MCLKLNSEYSVVYIVSRMKNLFRLIVALNGVFYFPLKCPLLLDCMRLKNSLLKYFHMLIRVNHTLT